MTKVWSPAVRTAPARRCSRIGAMGPAGWFRARMRWVSARAVWAGDRSGVRKRVSYHQGAGPGQLHWSRLAVREWSGSTIVLVQRLIGLVRRPGEHISPRCARRPFGQHLCFSDTLRCPLLGTTDGQLGQVSDRH